MPVVKSDAYGHGLSLVVRALLDDGVRWFGVNSLEEGLAVREVASAARILVLGYVPPQRFARAIGADLDLTITNPEEIPTLDETALGSGRRARVHIKVETGTHRRGVPPEDFGALAEAARRATALDWVGISTHFANIEDTINHAYAEEQLERFREADHALAGLGMRFVIRHTACTAATLLFPETHFDLVRVGIGLYGLWPSRETLLSFRLREKHPVTLRPCMTWKTRIVQLKPVRAGSFVGYGRTYRTTVDSRIAVLPVGYYEGYDRKLSNAAHVLIRDRRAPVRGRVCMNMSLVDVTHIPDVAVGDEVVLLGRQAEETLSADDLAAWAGTINYEIVSRIHPSIPRIAARDPVGAGAAGGSGLPSTGDSV